MNKTIMILMLSCGIAHAETKLYSDALNLPIGSSYEIGNTTFYADGLNLPIGTKNTIGSTFLYADGLNLPAGSVVNAGPNAMSNSYQPWESKRSGYEQF